MSMILCPECGTKISDKAVQCPFCGFQSKDPTRPISEQDTYEVEPVFKYEIIDENDAQTFDVISYEDNKELVGFFGSWKNIQAKLPDIAEVIKELAKDDHVMLAKMDSYVKKLIDNGTYHFVLDKNGEILPSIRGKKGFVKQVRLVDQKLAPNINGPLSNLATQAMMTQILEVIDCIGEQIRGIHIELQNDRIAMAEGVMDKLKQAAKITDSKLRSMALLNIISSATDAKRTLMRNFTQNLLFVMENANKSELELLLEKKGTSADISQKATDALQELSYITNTVKAECEGYAFLGEIEPCRECLVEFKDFVLSNKLDDRNTLLTLNGNTARDGTDIVNEFSGIANRISVLNNEDKLEEKDIPKLLQSDSEKGEGNDE